MKELIEISKWSDKAIEWNTHTNITTMDIWQRKEAEEKANAVKNYVLNKIGKITTPQEFIDALADEKEYNPLAAGAIVNALMYDSNNCIPDVKLDATKLQTPLDAVGLGAKGGKIYVNGHLGKYCFEKAENTKVIVEGDVGLRSMDRSRGVEAIICGNIGELYGWQSGWLRSLIKGRITGNYAFAESEGAQASIAGKIQATGVGMGSQGLKILLGQRPASTEFMKGAKGAELRIRKKAFAAKNELEQIVAHK